MRISDLSADVCSSDLEVARGLAEQQVARLVRLPALDDRQIGADAAFEDIFLAVEHLGFLALGDLGADAGLGIETGDTRPARAAALGKRALGTEFDLPFTRKELALELLVLDRKSKRLTSSHES